MDRPAVHAGTILMAFLAIMDPIANVSLFVGMTQGIDAATRRRIAIRSISLAFVIVAAFALAGREIFALFGITLPAFKIAGGALVGLVGFHMLQGESSNVHAPSAHGDQEEDAVLRMAITPLAMPVLAGPGTIATAMNFAAGSTAAEIARVIGAFGVVCALTLVAFLLGPALIGFLGKNGIKVISQLMGLILAVVGVQMLISGVGAGSG